MRLLFASSALVRPAHVTLSVARFVALALALATPALGACSSDDGGGSSGNVTPCEGDGCPKTPCTADERTDDSGACVPLGTRTCAAGFVVDDSGFGCKEVVPPAACGPGTMPVLGETACVPVAAAACTPGFERRPEGWGCRAVVPAAACTGATRTALGSTTCVPVGDCNAPFPPAAATYFVDPAGVVDATHLRTINAALAAAPAGATIAIAAGTYAESLAPPRAVHLVGRCAAQVSITPPAGTAGLKVASALDVELAGVTVTGGLGGVVASGGARVTVRDAVVDAVSDGGIVLATNGTKVDLVRAVVRGTLAVPEDSGSGHGITVGGGATLSLVDSDLSANNDFNVVLAAAGAKATIEHSVIERAIIGKQGFGDGLVARNGSVVDVKTSAFVRNHDTSLVSFGVDSKVTATDCTIEDTENGTEDYGRGAQAVGKGQLFFVRSTVAGNTDIGVAAEGSEATLTDSVVIATQPSANGGGGNGVLASKGGHIVVASSALVANHQSAAIAVGTGSTVAIDGSIVRDNVPDRANGGFGLAAQDGGTASAKGSAFVANTAAGLYAVEKGSKLTVDACLVTGTLADATGAGGRGMTLENGAAGTVTGSAFLGNRDIGISVKTGTLTVDQSVVRGTLVQAKNGSNGRGIEAGSGATASIQRTTLVGNHASGVVAFNGSKLDLADSWIADTARDQQANAGRAVTVQNASLTMVGVVAQRSAQAGVVAADNGSLTMRSCRIEDVEEGEPGTFGHGIVATLASSVILDDVTVRRCAAVGLVFDDSSGVVRASRVTDNAVGIYAQNGSELQQVTDAPEEPSPNVVAVTADTAFTDNATRVGSGVVSVPSPL